MPRIDAAPCMRYWKVGEVPVEWRGRGSKIHPEIEKWKERATREQNSGRGRKEGGKVQHRRDERTKKVRASTSTCTW